MSPQQTPQFTTPQQPGQYPRPYQARPQTAQRSYQPGPILPMRQSSGATKGMRASIIAVAGLVLAAFFAMAIYGVVSMVLTRSASTSVELPAEATTINVSVPMGDVVIRETDTDVPRLSVNATGTGVRDVADPVVETRGDRVDVEVPRPDRFGRWFGINEGRQDVILEVPADGVERSFTASSEYGDLESSVDASAVNLESNYGSVTISGAVQDTTLATSYGEIEAEGLAVNGSLNAESDNGDISVELRDDVAPVGRISASTNYGDVNVEVPDVGDPDFYRVSLSTDFGDEDNDLQDSAGSQPVQAGEDPVNIDLSTKNGDASIDYLN